MFSAPEIPTTYLDPDALFRETVPDPDDLFREVYADLIDELNLIVEIREIVNPDSCRGSQEGR
jgi:hypothetical protein